ncbi:MAG: hypothetical protein K2O32_02185 [Acetatifactor sp.]|nr:hypothetical protein [Acetatifactor sp.]
MAEINLEADGKTLQLLYGISDVMVWCQVYLVKDGVRTSLGAETIDRILPRLVISFMDIEDRKFFNYRGLELYPITNLQPLSTLAGRIDESGELELVFLDTPGNIIPLMKLTTDDKVKWITQIFEYLTEDIQNVIGGLMVEKNIKTPEVYKSMSWLGYLTQPNYLWIYEMRWRPIDKILQYEYYEDEYFIENKTMIPFAQTGGGDDWLWVPNGENKEYCVGICCKEEREGVYYAKNMEDAILRRILEYVTYNYGGFCMDESQRKTPDQMGEKELMQLLEKYKSSFHGVLNVEYLGVISHLRERKLQHVKNEIEEWDALLTEDEYNDLVKKYIDFELLDQKFVWRIEKKSRV